MAKQDDGRSFFITFDYGQDAAFDQLSTAMQAFSDAYASYSRSKKASLSIKGIQSGSLICQLEAPRRSWTGLEVMVNDFQDLMSGKKSVLMTDIARTALKRMLDNVQTVKLDIDSKTYELNSSVVNLLEQKSQESNSSQTSHAGILDRVDLKANTFRIMLPHGQRVNCSPALPFSESFSVCLRHETPRVKVIGKGKFRPSDVVPNNITVTSVEVIESRPTFISLMNDLIGQTDRIEIRSALDGSLARAVESYERFDLEE